MGLRPTRLLAGDELDPIHAKWEYSKKIPTREELETAPRAPIRVAPTRRVWIHESLESDARRGSAHIEDVMTRDELLQRLGDREDNYTERKLEGAAHQGEIRKAMVAFSNSVPLDREAVLFVGVADDGKVIGVKDTDAMQKTVRQAAENCYPPIVRYSSDVLDVDGALVVALTIGASENRPHFSGPAYVRKGSESVAASPELFEELIASRNDKAGAILRRKGQGAVIVARKVLGRLGRTGDPMYAERLEGIILDCTAHVLTFRIPSKGADYREPLERVTILDDALERPMMLEIDE